jgi:aminoglycoside phosphotransferase family enzyme/predicted kinase
MLFMSKTPAIVHESGGVSAQEHVLPFLLNPQSYPHCPKSVRLVQTHASFIFIAPPFVYKVKKPVNFGFLDFSTLEKRRHFCEREVALNRRLAPRVYLGVVPISKREDGFTFDDGGEVVEYAVKMRKLSERHFLDRLVERDEATPGDLDRIVQVLKQFYEAQHPTEEVEAWGRIDRLRISTEENFRQTREFIGALAEGASVTSASGESEGEHGPSPAEGRHTISRPAFEAIRSYTHQIYERNRRLFASRIEERRIRDCHGDLHLEHIHVTPRALNIYDCIEFNDRFRYVDVANDAAFLAMDLDYEGRSDLSHYFARQMASALNDEGMPRLFDFYKCYRAYVRGKVESLHSVAATAPEEERRASAGRARRYFQLALRYAIAGSQPLVLVVMGRIASGKSTLARALGVELGWDVYSSDHLRKKMAGFPLFERRSSEAREHLYSAAMTKRTYDHLLTSAQGEVQKGHGVILDATFSRREHRDLLAKRFGKQGIPWRVIEAQASNAVVRQRLRAREARPGEVSDARLEDFAKLTGLYEAPVEVSSQQGVKVRTNGPLDLVVTKALKSLARLQVELPAPQRRSVTINHNPVNRLSNR